MNGEWAPVAGGLAATPPDRVALRVLARRAGRHSTVWGSTGIRPYPSGGLGTAMDSGQTDRHGNEADRVGVAGGQLMSVAEPTAPAPRGQAVST